MPNRILIADDNPTVRVALRHLLESTDFGEVIDAENGQEAIARAQEFRPNVIVLDLVMPVMDGLVAAKEFSKIMPDVPLVMHTLHWSPQVELEAQKVGVRKVVAKTDSKGLVSTLHQLLFSEPPAAVTGGSETAPAPILPPDVAALPPVLDSSNLSAPEKPEAATSPGPDDVAGSGPAN